MKFIQYLKDYKKFKESGYSCIDELIVCAEAEPPPILLTKIKEGEVVENLEVRSPESLGQACGITIRIGTGE